MKIKQVPSWREASQAIGAYAFTADDVERAKDAMKASHPGIVPHTVYWHTNSGKDGKALMNTYYFCWKFGERS